MTLSFPKLARLNRHWLEHFHACLDSLEAIPGLDLLLLRSDAQGQFLPQFDPAELLSLADDAARRAWLRRGEELCDRLEVFGKRVPIVAIIHNACSGPGLELALACNYRLMIANADAGMSVPTLPSWGGIGRLRSRLGRKAAQRFFEQDSPISARQAQQLGIVDDAFCRRRATIEIQIFVDRLQDRTLRGRLSRHKRRLAKSFPIRHKRRLSEPVGESLKAYSHSMADGRAMERNQSLAWLASATCLNQCQQEILATRPTIIKTLNPIPNLPTITGIVGGGDLGARLAFRLSLQGKPVILKEQDADGLAATDRRLETLFRERVTNGWLTPLEAHQANLRIRRNYTWNDLANAGWIIETSSEDIATKQAIFQTLERICSPRTILVSSTSTIAIESIQATLSRPNRVAGLHFPADTLAEITPGPQTDNDTIATLLEWSKSLAEVSILVSDIPGRLVSSAYHAYLTESIRLIAEGFSVHEIDRLMRAFGMSQGPLEIIDNQGFDHFANQWSTLPGKSGPLDRPRGLGLDGRINQGFYQYHKGHRQAENPIMRMALWAADAHPYYHIESKPNTIEAEDRLLLLVVNMLAEVANQQPTLTPACIDMAFCRATNWPIATGGPLAWAKMQGLPRIIDELHRLAEKHGKRFMPSAGLLNWAKSGKLFAGANVLQLTRVEQAA